MVRIVIGCLVALFALQCGNASPPKQPDANELLIANLTSANWPTVEEAKETLESRQAEAIPLLMKLLDRDEKVKLENTADLIYPGAEKSSGHGMVIGYNLDWLPIRAGWALEEITFQNFGFEGGEWEWGNPDPSKAAENQKLRAEAVARAKTWWQRAQGSWTRLDGIVEALRSDDVHRQGWALGYVRAGKTKCDGLTLESFEKQIKPEAQRLLHSKEEWVRQHAQYLLEDKEGRWLKYKTEAAVTTP